MMHVGVFMLTHLSSVRSIVFDLDGTLYTHEGIAKEIWQAACSLIASSRGISLSAAQELLKKARKALEEVYDEEPTLTNTCLELGIEVADLHRAFQTNVRPDRYLKSDPVLFALLDSLRDDCDLYLYTNNNLPLSQKILALLGVEELFERLYTIEFSWVPKPDKESLSRILEDIGGEPESFLFVGDRRQVDLKGPEALNIPTLLVSEVSDLLQIHKLMGIIP